MATAGKSSPTDLWRNIYAFMTDSVTKNLEVENLVSEMLGTTYIPIHILCKSHTCEKLDECCIDTIVEIEKQLKLADTITKRQPRLKSFVRQNKCLTICAMKALLKLVAREESGKPTSLSKEFDAALEEEGLTKSLSLYIERRWTKTGYTAGALVECIPILKKILNETTLNNMLVQACRLYLECDFIVAAMRALANFTYFVTMPYLNLVEKSDQNKLCVILPELYKGLSEGNQDTLKEYHVEWTHVKMKKLAPSSALDHHLLTKMSYSAAEGIKMQCGREYFPDDERKPRVTQLHKMNENERKNIPSENLLCERYLGKMGYLASISAAHSNKNFKAKRIRDDLMFVNNSEDEEHVLRSTNKIIQGLKEMEVIWSSKQEAAMKEKIAANLRKRTGMKKYREILLKRCKNHGGPVVTMEELKQLVKETEEEKLRSCLRQEIAFKKVMHPLDAKEKPHLYKMNFLSHEELLENLVILLDADITEEETDVLFPTEEEIFHQITGKQGVIADEPTALVLDEESFASHFTFMQPMAVVWDNADRRYWCIAFFLSNVDEMLEVDNLVEKKNGGNREWVRPNMDDVQNVLPYFIIPCQVQGDWDHSKRQSTFIVTNVDEIEKCFVDFVV